MREREIERGNGTVQGGAKSRDRAGSWGHVVHMARNGDDVETQSTELGWLAWKQVVVEEKTSEKRR